MDRPARARRQHRGPRNGGQTNRQGFVRVWQPPDGEDNIRQDRLPPQPNNDNRRGGRGGYNRGRGGNVRGARDDARPPRRDGRGDANGTEKRERWKAGSVDEPINYQAVVEFLKLDAQELILRLATRSTGFFALINLPLEKEIKPDLLALIFKALCKAMVTCTKRQFLNEFLSDLCEKKNFFPGRVQEYLATIDKLVKPLQRDRLVHLNAVNDIISVLKTFQQTMPQQTSDDLSVIIPGFESKMRIIAAYGNEVCASAQEELKELRTQNEKIEIEVIDEKTKKLRVQMEKVHAQSPPEDFRILPICPDHEDIHGNRDPFIRPNIFAGPYNDVEHYLDVQFRLLREDFVRPLREGIQEYLRMLNEGKKKKESIRSAKDVKVYHGVTLDKDKTAVRPTGTLYTAHFDKTPFRHINWQTNKRLISGSLLCLSADNFETFVFASVTGMRKPHELSRGIFHFHLEHLTAGDISSISRSSEVTMVESSAYFEAYRYNLDILKKFNVENLPLKQYIVDVEQNVGPPTYADEDTRYDFSHLRHSPSEEASGRKIISRRREDDENSDSSSEDTPATLLGTANLLEDDNWPTAKDLSLDDSQFDALKAALTKQLCVIQGPPGTGKTFIGLRIVQTLLRNRVHWRGETKSPILVVCYTNHALDQFLEGMLRFTKEIVRIGGRCQNETLEPYTLQSIKRMKVSKKSVSRQLFISLKETRTAMYSMQKNIEKRCVEMNKAKTTILGFELVSTIESFSPSHLSAFSEYAPDYRSILDSVLRTWLSVEVTVDEYEEYEDEEDDQTDARLMAFPDDEEQSDQEMDYDMEDEIQFIQDQLIEEDDEETLYINEMSKKYRAAEAKKQMRARKHNEWVNLEERRLRAEIRFHLTNGDAMDENEAKLVQNPTALSLIDRWRLYKFWAKRYYDFAETGLDELKQKYSDLARNHKLLKNEEDFEVIRKCAIIGMTTTGAAKYRNIIEEVGPRIVVVEEAAEVLEAHIVTSLTKETCHLILIGDHQQLKPSTTVYELSQRFKLDVSLFERIINNKIDFKQLKIQHRMKPCIASLLVPYIYPELKNHESVEKYAAIKGVSKSMFFIDHAELEVDVNETKSRLNAHEASFITRLALYFVQQGYGTDQVTILTTYSGQLFQIRQEMKHHSMLEGIRATVVDNYQGEESDIILLSFVRSNVDANIGFLKVSNRVNVALSRAKKGLFAIGNFSCLAEKSPLWQNIIKELKLQRAIGKNIELVCQNHPDLKTYVEKGSDFSKVPEGGCFQPCLTRLECGHACPLACHVYDLEHENIVCPKPCDEVMCLLNHRCPRKCHFGEDHGLCQKHVPKLRPKCGHEISCECHEDPDTAKCSSPCEKNLDCGHPCPRSCSSSCDTARCLALVELDGACGHKISVKCYLRGKDEEMLVEHCEAECGKELTCEHICRGKCSECYQGRYHLRCNEKCNRPLICGHICRETCAKGCPPCYEPCLISCDHRQCGKRCGAVCAPCNEKCNWKCATECATTKECEKMCHETCDRDECLQPCKKVIEKCGHQCIGICGEKCPKKCRICDKGEGEEFFRGDLRSGTEDEDSLFVELVGCEHVFEVDALRSWLSREATEGDQMIQLPTCPACKTIVRESSIFNSLIQENLKDLQKMKSTLSGKLFQNRVRQKQLQSKYQVLESSPLSKVARIAKATLKQLQFKKEKPPRSAYILDLFENVHQFLSEIDLVFISTDSIRHNIALLEKPKEVIHERIRALTNRNVFGGQLEFKSVAGQEMVDIKQEIVALGLFGKAFAVANQAEIADVEVKSLFASAFEMIYKRGPFTEDRKEEFKRLVDEGSKKMTGRGIALEEKKMILAALSFGQQGHWYKCKSGHVYSTVSDCGAMLESRCSECAQCNHQLRGDNTKAS